MERGAAVPSVDPAAAAERLRAGTSPAPLLLDVREPAEFAAVRVEGSSLLPLSEFAARYGEVPRDRPLVVMCHMGGRSAMATMHLLANGWTDVTNLAGGIDAWERAGLPVRRGPPAPGEGALPTADRD
jgi:rhodanese-related sulfurtransferase